MHEEEMRAKQRLAMNNRKPFIVFLWMLMAMTAILMLMLVSVGVRITLGVWGLL